VWNPEYFHKEVLQESESIESKIRFVPHMLVLLFISYIIIYSTVYKGLKSSIKVIYYTVPAPCFLLVILLIKGVTLEGSEIGFKELLMPDWS